jgi:prepilin-type N-terminal cleavage/methylation domain-containing protein
MSKIQNTKTTNLKKAFTLIELLVVIAIISLLSAVVLNSVASARMKANDTKIAEDLRSFRKAAELYYNDYRVYPATTIAINNQEETVLAVNNIQKNNWAHKLAFFVKTAEAAVTHTTPLCKNFDNAATAMVQSKYLATVPVHPYDNDATGVCYKAVRSASGNTFSGYGPLTTQVDISNSNDPSGVGRISKRSGFVAGDAGDDGINELIVATREVDPIIPYKEIVYPAGLDGNPLIVVVGVGSNTPLVTVDQVDGITNGTIVPSCSSGQFYDLITKSCQNLPRRPRGDPPVIIVPEDRPVVPAP